MNISRTDLDALNATINITLDRTDYQEKVDAVLINYRKTANIPGFRKGHVPMGMIKKQYGQAVTADEVNKILREQLDTFIKEEKLDLLGNPLPKAPEQELDWSADSMDFEFELGLAPKFEVKLDILKKVVRYEIEPDAKMFNEQMDYVRKQYGKIVSQKNPEKGYEITAQFRNEQIELEKMSTFTFEDIKSKKVIKELKEVTTGSVLMVLGKGLFSDDATAKRLLSLDDEQLKTIKTAELTV